MIILPGVIFDNSSELWVRMVCRCVLNTFNPVSQVSSVPWTQRVRPVACRRAGLPQAHRSVIRQKIRPNSWELRSPLPLLHLTDAPQCISMHKCTRTCVLISYQCFIVNAPEIKRRKHWSYGLTDLLLTRWKNVPLPVSFCSNASPPLNASPSSLGHRS